MRRDIVWRPMGYRTRYALRTVNPGDDAHIRAEILKHHSVASPFCADENWNGTGECKWYSSNEDCAKVSADNPDIVFRIYGCGECESDSWVRRYEGGGYVEVEACWDDIDTMMDDECELRESRK